MSSRSKLMSVSNLVPKEKTSSDGDEFMQTRKSCNISRGFSSYHLLAQPCLKIPIARGGME